MQPFKQWQVLRRIDLVEPAGEHRDCPGLAARLMGGGVDATRQPRDDDKAGLARDRGASRAVNLSAGGRGIARADQGDAGTQQGVARPARPAAAAANSIACRALRVVRLAERDEAGAEALHGGELALGLVLAAEPELAAGLAPEIGQRLEGGRRAAEAVHQVAEGARADAFAADQPEPVDALAVGEDDASHSGSAFLADLAFAALQEPGDVLAMHEPEQQGQGRHQRRGPGVADPEPQQQRRQQARQQRRKRGIAAEIGDADPDRGKDQRDREFQADEDAEIGRDPLAAPELQPDREEMAEEGAETRQKRGLAATEQEGADQHGRRALEHVARQRQRRQLLVAGPQDIGRADIARADAAQIGAAGQPRQDDPERDRAEEIAEDEQSRYGHPAAVVFQHADRQLPEPSRENTVRPATTVRKTRPWKRAFSKAVFFDCERISALP